MKKNKTAKYLRYAFGEIILVVIGILIALSINNWNENRKNHKLKVFYLKSLVNDLTKDTLDINRVAIWQEEEIDNLTSFIDRIYNEPSTTIDTIQKIAQFEFYPDYFVKRDYNNNTFNTIISTGNIELFNRELINELMQLQNYQQDEIKRSKNNLAQYDLLSNTYITRYPTLVERPQNNIVHQLLWNKIDQKDFVGNFVALLDSKRFTFQGTLQGQKQVKNKSIEILNLIDNLLNE